MAISFVDDSPATVDDLLAFFEREVRVPLVRDEGQSEVFRETSSDVVFTDEGPEEVNTREVGLPVLEPCHHEVVIERVLLVSAFVAQCCQVVGVFLDRVVDPIIEEMGFSGEFLELSGGFLEICEFTSGCYDEVGGDLFEAIDSVVL